MLDFTNSSDHGALIEEDNKLEGVVGCFVASLQRHISSSWKLYVQVIQNFVYWFHFANISVLKLRWDLPVPKNCYNLSFAKELLK
jgi:hypothetical protein